MNVTMSNAGELAPPRPPAPAFPAGPLALSLTLVLATLGWVVFLSFEADRTIDKVVESEFALEEKVGIIIHLDEVLTMSARMAAQTGDPQWEARYRIYDPILAAAIEETYALAPDALDAESVEATDVANKRLVAMENEVFDLVRAGRLDEARAIMEGEEYAAQKAIYAAGITGLHDSVHEEAEAVAARVDRALFRNTLVASALGLLAAGAIAATYMRVRAWRGALLAAERQRLVALRDASEAKERSLRAEKLAVLGQLTAGVAHEVNNPLQYLMTNTKLALATTEIALRDERMPEEVRGRLARAAHAIRANGSGLGKIQRLVLSLRALSRTSPRSGEPVDLAKAADDVIAVAHAKASRAQVTLVSDVAALPHVPASADEIGQVLLNLVLNGVEACEGGGTVTLRARAEPDAVVFDVEDTGRGIDPRVQPRIFSPFVTTKPHGNGLGLSVSQRIVHDQGGTLTFVTRAGEGTTFTMRLPRTPPTRAA